MKRQRPKLGNDDSTKTIFHYNTRSSTRKGISTTDTADERRKKKKISDDISKNSNLDFPVDLIMEILKRLPLKTLARFLRVSKLWSSILRSRDFTKLFLAESCNRPPRLFFNFRRRTEANFIFSSNQGEDPATATYHFTPPIYENTKNSSSYLHDLICYRTACPNELVVYNFTTKRSLTLPKLEPIFKHFLCYDPIDAVYKVLCVMIAPCPVFKVLTLGKGSEWRMIETSSNAHLPFNTHICTSGVLYYDAYADTGEELGGAVMSFDLRSEKFDFIKGPATVDFRLRDLSALTLYEDKLAFISTEISADGSMVLWVLEDALKHQWLKKIFVLPNTWTRLAPETPLSSPPHELHVFLNITVTGEFILAPFTICVPPFYVLYYDPKRNSLRKVSIQGIMEHEVLQWNREKLWFLYNIFSSEVESLTFW